MSTEMKARVAFVSMLASAGLTIGKFVAGLMSGSLALLGEALHSLLDFAATAMTWFAVRISDKPADDEHHYGHGKVESIAALIEVGLLLAVAVWLLREGIGRLMGDEHTVEITWLSVGVVIISIVVDFYRARALRKAAIATSSHALEADALHFQSDMYSSMIVLAGLGAVWMGFPKADAIAAIVVAVFITLASIDLGKRTIDALMDAAPEGLADGISKAALAIRGVSAVERVRVRPVGANIFAELTVSVPRTLPLDKVMAIKTRIHHEVLAIIPNAELTITAEPRALDDETILDRIMLIAASRRIPVHHITVQQLDGRLSVAFDIEVDGRMSLEAAHIIASRMEAAIREEFGPDTEVETHIEPLEINHLDGRSVSEAARTELVEAIIAIAAALPGLHDIHDVRVHDTDKGRVLAMHCCADPKASVADVHTAVDELERAVRTAYPEIVRVITHAEPTHIHDTSIDKTTQDSPPKEAA